MMFCPYVCCGDPNIEFSYKLIKTLAPYSDIIEVGIPFSDPIADGKTIQKAANRALKNGTNIDKIFEMVQRLRKDDAITIPLIFMTYFNIIYAYGRERFLEKMKTTGIEGLIIPDLPFGEDPEFQKMAAGRGICIVSLIAQNTKDERTKRMLNANGAELFTYLVSVTGVTGARDQISSESIDFVKRIRKMAGSQKRLCIGFGISKKEQADEFGKAGADGIIVGSKIINIYSEYLSDDGKIEQSDQQKAIADVDKFAREFKKSATNQ